LARRKSPDKRPRRSYTGQAMHIHEANNIACGERDSRVGVAPQTLSVYHRSGRRQLAAMRRYGYSIDFAGLCAFAEARSYARRTIHQYRTHLRYAIADRLLTRFRDADRLHLSGHLAGARVAVARGRAPRRRPRRPPSASSQQRAPRAEPARSRKRHCSPCAQASATSRAKARLRRLARGPDNERSVAQRGYLG